MLDDSSATALAPYGWNDRVAALLVDLAGPDTLPGRVVRVERSACFVATPTGERMARAATLPAVGDWAAVHIDGRDATVVGVADRWSALARRDADDAVQVMAANVDVVLVAVPCDRASLARAEREVTAVWESGARPVVLLTKHDLAPPELGDSFRERLVGTDVLAVSVVTGEGVDEVAAMLAPHHTGVLLGPSGAGKSSLVNALLGREAMAVGDVREGDHRGRHTTSNRQLLVVPTGGVLIDTPGIRSLALAGGLDGGGLGAAFPDIDELAAGCRFADCQHESEPRCAVRAAVDDGTLDPARLVSYHKLQRELDFEERRTDWLARQEHARQWKAIARIGKERARKR